LTIAITLDRKPVFSSVRFRENREREKGRKRGEILGIRSGRPWKKRGRKQKGCQAPVFVH